MQFPIQDYQKPPSGLSQFTGGMSQGMDLYSQILRSIAAPEMMKMQQEQAQQDLQKSQAQSQLYNAQTQKALQYKPVSPSGQDLADLQNSIDTYGPDSPQAKMVQAGIRQRAIQDQQRNNYYDILAKSVGLRYTPTINREQIASSAQSQGIPSQGLPAYFTQLGNQAVAPQQQQAQVDPFSGISIMGSPQAQGQQAQAAMQQQQQPLDISQANFTPEQQEQAKQEAQQTQSQILKTITPASVQQAQYAGARAEMILDSVDQSIDQGALKYSGAKGKALKAQDELMATLTGKVSPSLLAYRNMQGQLNTLKDEVAITLKVPADQISRGDLGTLFDINQYSTNADTAKKQIANVRNLVKKSENINMSGLSGLAKRNREMTEKDNMEVSPDELKSISPQAANQLGITYKGSNGKMYTPQELQAIIDRANGKNQ